MSGDSDLVPKCEKNGDVLGVAESVNREHVERENCWCSPTLYFVAENGTKVWVHHKPS